MISEWTTIADLAWAAGIIDGEGSLHIARSRKYHLPQLRVEMCHRPTLAKLQEIFGGRLWHRKKPRTDKWRQTWNWHAQGSFLFPILKAIRPFMVTKANEADIILNAEHLWFNCSTAALPLTLFEGREEVLKALKNAHHFEFKVDHG